MAYIRTVYREIDREQRIFTFQATQLIWLFFGILEALLAWRVALKLVGANPNSPFGAMVYDLTSLFLVPFTGLTFTPVIDGMVFEISSIIAMFVYALIAWVVARVVWLIFYRP